MNFSFGLTHPVRSKRNQDSIIIKESNDGNPWNLHVKFLFIVTVKLTLRLMNLQELQDDILIDIVSNWFLDLFHVEIEPFNCPGWVMRQRIEHLLDHFLRFYFFHQERNHLIDKVWNYISVLIFPFNSEIQPHVFTWRRSYRGKASSLFRFFHLDFFNFFRLDDLILDKPYFSHIGLRSLINSWRSWVIRFISNCEIPWLFWRQNCDVVLHLCILIGLRRKLVKVRAIVWGINERVVIVVVDLNKLIFTIAFSKFFVAVYLISIIQPSKPAFIESRKSSYALNSSRKAMPSSSNRSEMKKNDVFLIILVFSKVKSPKRSLSV